MDLFAARVSPWDVCQSAESLGGMWRRIQHRIGLILVWLVSQFSDMLIRICGFT